MTTELMKEIAPFLHINFTENAEGKITIEEEGHERDSGKIRHAVKRIIKATEPDLYDKVEAHVSDTFYKATERTPPFIVLMMAAGHISYREYCEKILAAPSDAEIVCNYIEEDKFVEVLFDSYRKLEAARAGGVATPEVTVPSGVIMPSLPSSAEQLNILNTVLKSYGQPTWNEVVEGFKSVGSLAGQMETIKKQAEEQRKISDKAVQSLKDALGGLQSELAAKPFKDTKVTSDGTIPSGKIVMKAIDKVFPLTTSAAFDIPVWEWDGAHPDVPTIDPHYIFREDLLVKALYAIVSNQRMYLQGHTGAGKTTLLEQIAAHLNWPFARINFDSEITRMDLIGRDTLKDGKSVFVDGILPRLMQSPYIVAFDEIDFCRPDVAYVMQSVLEGNSFRITEDGGRLVSPDPMFRMFATGNTVGQGDEHGMYQGARPQSLAFLDRFTIWGKVDYLNKEQRADLLSRHNPGLTDGETIIINKYVEEHLKAFQDAKILQPISPRGMLAVGKAVAHLNTVFRGRKDNMTEALKMTVLDRATQSDYAVIRGIIDRVVK